MDMHLLLSEYKQHTFRFLFALSFCSLGSPNAFATQDLCQGPHYELAVC